MCFWSAALKEITTQLLKRPIPVVVHGYDYPVPDGRGFLGGFGFLPGPWLQPGFHRKGFRISPRTLQSLGKADRFVQRHAPRADPHGWIRARPLRDLRGTLSHSAGYNATGRTTHPTRAGSVRRDKIASAI